MDKKNLDFTIMRIAGNLLSGYQFDAYSYADQLEHVQQAVRMARAIVADVQRPAKPYPPSEGTR